jgi:hypothetical protein
VLKAATAPGASGEVINVATGRQISISELAKTLGEIIGVTAAPVHIDPRPGDVRDSLADVSKAKAILGYEPTVGLEEGSGRPSTGIAISRAVLRCRSAAVLHAAVLERRSATVLWCCSATVLQSYGAAVRRRPRPRLNPAFLQRYRGEIAVA